MTTFEDRRYQGLDAKELNEVLIEAMKILEASDLGQSILKGAHYKGVVSESDYEESVRKMHGEEAGFAVDEVYIGYDGRTKGGRCTMTVANDGDKDRTHARGEVYLNVEYMKNLKKELGEKEGTQYLANILAHEFTHANQGTHIVNQISDSASRLPGKWERTQDGGGFIKKDGKKIEMGNEGTLLTEANSDTAGLMMLKKTGEISERLANYYQEDIKAHGWISESASKYYRDVLVGSEDASAIDVFHHYLQDKIEYLGGRGYMPLNFEGKEDWIEACYQEHLFGEDKEKFIEDTKEVVSDAASKYMSQMSENLQNPKWLESPHPSPYYKDKTNAEFLWENFTAEAKGKDRNKVPTFEEIVAQKNKYFSAFGVSDGAFVQSDVFKKSKQKSEWEKLSELRGLKRYEAPAIKQVSSEMSEILKNSRYVERE